MNKWKAVATVVQAVIAFTLVTQSDVTVLPILKFILGAVSVGIAAIDWGAFGEAKDG